MNSKRSFKINTWTVYRSKNNWFFLLFSFLTALILTWGGCAEFDSQVGSDQLPDELTGELLEMTFPVDVTQTATLGDQYKASVSYQILGSQAGFTSEIVYTFLHFGDLSDSLINIDSASFTMFGLGFVDSAAVEDWTPFNAYLYRFDESWELTDLKYGDEYESTLLDTVTIGTAESRDTLTFPIPVETITDWQENWTHDSLTYGFRLVPEESSTFLKQFTPRNYTTSGLLPVLKVYGDLITENDTLPDTFYNVYPTKLATNLVNDTLPLNDDYLTISEGFGRRILLHSDLSALGEEEISINKVQLILHTDHDAEENFSTTNALTAVQITSDVDDWATEPDSAEFGTISSITNEVSEDSSTVVVDLTLLARLWAVIPDTNQGVAIRAISERTAIGRRLFYGLSAPEDLQPRLRVIFTEFER